MSTIYNQPQSQESTSPEHNITRADLARIDHTEQKHGNRIHSLEIKVGELHKQILRLRRDIGRIKGQLDNLSARTHRG